MRRQLEPLLGDNPHEQKKQQKRFVLLSSHTAYIITQCSELLLRLPTVLLGFPLLGPAAPCQVIWSLPSWKT